MKNFIYLGFFLTLVSCGFFSKEKPLREPKDMLTQSYAAERQQQISDVRYQLKFDLTDKDSFQGTTAIHFQLKQAFYLTVDFGGGDIQELVVNGEKVSPLTYNGFFFEIPMELQKVGANSILVQYTQNYSKNGTGLYKYNDVQDDNVYLYSHFEPYDANKMFPCFDQPNLKATYATSVLAPKGWQVITSTRESEVIQKGEIEEWFFPKSQKFSTYSYSLHAGNYQVWEDVAKTKNHEIPLRLFARKSLAPYVKTQDWFDWTKQGFEFFESYFSYPYPYLKYDQVIVPDFNFGAMENVAAVTFNEDRYVSKGEKTRKQRRRLATTLLHEMAHMWFGNLVTMNWWDDLWLNESFATHTSFEALVNATEFEEGWKFFNAWSKQKAYRQDQSSTTHPVAQDCRNTSEAFANFDSITYGKGASVLKQLSFYLGEKTYKKALAGYFKSFEHSNATLADFMGKMEEASNKELKTWQNRWLERAMVNEVEVHFTCHRGRINNFEIFQTATKDHPTLRSHKTLVALFRKRGGRYKISSKVPVKYSGERTLVKKMNGKLCPDIVYPNYQDHDYVSVILDKKSLRNIKSNLVTLDDAFLKSVLWSDLWSMVLNKRMSMARFLEIAEFNALVETDHDILATVFGNVSEILKKHYPDSGQPWASKREVWLRFFEQAFITKIYENISEPVTQKIWFENLVELAETPQVLQLLGKVIKRHRSGLPLTFEVDQDLRWSVLAALSSNGFEGVETLIAKEAKKDSSKRGQLNALYAKALEPNIEAKKSFFSDVLTKQKTESLGVLRTIMSGLFPSHQKNLHKKFVDQYYDSLRSVSKNSDQYYASTFTTRLVPAFCDQKSSTQISNFLAAEKGLAFPVVKQLKKALFENQRCYEMRRVLMNKSELPMTNERQ